MWNQNMAGMSVKLGSERLNALENQMRRVKIWEALTFRAFRLRIKDLHMVHDFRAKLYLLKQIYCSSAKLNRLFFHQNKSWCGLYWPQFTHWIINIKSQSLGAQINCLGLKVEIKYEKLISVEPCSLHWKAGFNWCPRHLMFYCFCNKSGCVAEQLHKA